MIDSISKTDQVLVLLNRQAVTGQTQQHDVGTPKPSSTETLQPSQQQQQNNKSVLALSWENDLLLRGDSQLPRRQSFLKGHGPMQQQTTFPLRNHATDALQVVLGEQSTSVESHAQLR